MLKLRVARSVIKFKLMCAQVAASTNKVTNFVGKVVNGFDIQKLIGQSIPYLVSQLSPANALLSPDCRLGQVLVRVQGQTDE